MYFAQCPEMTLGKEAFVECQLVDTRQSVVTYSMPSVARGHSTKCILKLKKIFTECQITGTRQRTLTYRRFTLSSSPSHSNSHRAAAALDAPLAVPSPGRAPRRPLARSCPLSSPRAVAALDAPRRRARASRQVASHPRPSPSSASPSATLHAGKVHATDLQPRRPVVSPATRRLARDQTSKVIYMK
jgi:hypothetical protein